jgi:anti-sigma factor RsiW
MSATMNTTTDRPDPHPDEELIHDFVDDELSADDRARVAAHLAACTSCRGLADSIVELGERTRRAFGSPPRIGAHTDAPDQWSAIEGALGARRRPRRLSPLAAAASVALLLAAGAALYATLGGARPEAPTPIASAAPVVQAPSVAIAAAYAPALGELERILATERARLQPETVATVEENLRILEQAIREIEAALASDPAHRGNLESLEGMYQTKLGVLRQVVTLTTGA